mmetsp:Transcript_22080/g.38178  ORF Transcript_22080/g.38178 Transcript_22080/m.38178 type:complete len:232 (+) Transcript_22080:1932-2627(+)
MGFALKRHAVCLVFGHTATHEALNELKVRGGDVFKHVRAVHGVLLGHQRGNEKRTIFVIVISWSVAVITVKLVDLVVQNVSTNITVARCGNVSRSLHGNGLTVPVRLGLHRNSIWLANHRLSNDRRTHHRIDIKRGSRSQHRAGRRHGSSICVHGRLRSQASGLRIRRIVLRICLLHRRWPNRQLVHGLWLILIIIISCLLRSSRRSRRHTAFICHQIRIFIRLIHHSCNK